LEGSRSFKVIDVDKSKSLSPVLVMTTPEEGYLSATVFTVYEQIAAK